MWWSVNWSKLSDNHLYEKKNVFGTDKHIGQQRWYDLFLPIISKCSFRAMRMWGNNWNSDHGPEKLDLGDKLQGIHHNRTNDS